MFEHNGTHSWLKEYIHKCKMDEIVIGHELMEMLDILLKHFMDPEITVDFTDAHKRIDFIETKCKHFEAPFAGKPFLLELFQKAFIEAIYSFKIYDSELDMLVRLFQEVLFLVGKKNGKALALDTPIPTPSGWRTMEDLKVGDFVFNELGKPVKIIKTSEIFKGHQCFEVEFEDGERIVADAEHIWNVTTTKSREALNYVLRSKRKQLRADYRENNGYYNITTAEMVKDFAVKKKDGSFCRYKYRVPITKEIEYFEKDLPIDPYLLGVWIGDGESNGARISVSVNDLDSVIDAVQQSNGEIISVRDDKSCKRIRITQKNKCFQTELRKLDLIRNKHIPDIFLQASVNQRYELLKGLMDTDGYCSKAGQCEFVQKNERVVKGIRELLSSLGIKNTVTEKIPICNGKECNKVYRVQFWTDKEHSCFKLIRKHERLKDFLNDRMLNKSIVGIKEIPSIPTKCIGVDSPKNLYLAGSNMTVTHNTPLIAAICLAEWFCGSMGLKILCSSNDYEQAALMHDAINAMREESPALDKVTRCTVKGIFFGNPKNPKSKGKFSKQNKGSIKKISAKKKSSEGRNIGVGAADEVHELASDIPIMPIRQGLATQNEPLYFELTTEGFVNDGYLDGRLKDARKVLAGELDRRRWLIWLYTQDSEKEIWQDERSWQKSNPNLGVSKKWSYLRGMVEEARTNKKTRVSVLAKDFNRKQNNSEAWLTPEEIENKEVFKIEDFRNCFAIGSVDLSKTGDLACARALLMRKGSSKKYVISQYFIPQAKLDSLTGEEKTKYEGWVDKGLITVTPRSEDDTGNENDFRLVTKWFVNLVKEYGIRFYKVGYDKWSAVYWVKEMTEDYGFDCVRVSQEFASMSEPMSLVEKDLRSNLLIYNDNPVDRYCLENTALCMNKKMEIMPVKIQGKEDKKIDGTVTMIIGYRIYMDNKIEFLELVSRQAA